MLVANIEQITELHQFEQILARTRRRHDRYGLADARSFLKLRLSLREVGVAIVDKNPKMRRCATHLLIYWGGTQAFSLLATVLRSDPSPVIRHEAAFALSTIRSPKVARALKDSITQDQSPIVQHESIEALGDSLGRKAERFLSRYRNSKDLLIRDTVAAILGE